MLTVFVLSGRRRNESSCCLIWLFKRAHADMWSLPRERRSWSCGCRNTWGRRLKRFLWSSRRCSSPAACSPRKRRRSHTDAYHSGSATAAGTAEAPSSLKLYWLHYITFYWYRMLTVHSDMFAKVLLKRAEQLHLSVGEASRWHHVHQLTCNVAKDQQGLNSVTHFEWKHKMCFMHWFRVTRPQVEPPRQSCSVKEEEEWCEDDGHEDVSLWITSRLDRLISTIKTIKTDHKQSHWNFLHKHFLIDQHELRFSDTAVKVNYW